MDAVLDAVEAYITTLPSARYELVRRERFCIEFRRGAWRGKWLDPSILVPKFMAIDRFDAGTWPTLLRVTALPSPGTFEIALLRDVRMPNGLPLKTPHHEMGDLVFSRETEGLIEYLTSFLHLPVRPDVRREAPRSNED
jgi:hypothetical protein